MKLNGILYKLFEVVEEGRRPGVFRKPLVEKLLHVPEQMGAALLLRERRDKVPVCGVEIGDEDTLVELSEMIPDHAGRTVSVNVVEGDLAVSKYPEPVALPAGLVGINASCFRKSLLEGFIQGRSLPADRVVEADNCARRDAQAADVLKDSRDIVVGDFDFIAEKGSLGSGIRPDEGVRNFIRTSAMDDLFAGGAPVMEVDKARCLQPAAVNVLLDMLRGMAAWGKASVSATRAFVKTDVNVFVDMVGTLPEVSRMAERGSPLFRVFRNVLLLISLERGLKRLAEFLFKLPLVLPEIFVLSYELFHLFVGKVHGELKLVNSFTEVIFFGKDSFGGFAAKEHAELLEGTIRGMMFSLIRIEPPLLHRSHPELFSLMHRTQGNRHPANQVTGCAGVAVSFYQKTRSMSI